VQVDFNQVNAVTKEINVSIPAETVDKAYEKYLRKASRSIEVPGFRKGKAPLNMVERLHAESLKEYFYKDYVDEVFEEIGKEHDLHYLLFPEVKEVNWEKGQEMTLKIEIEHEPTLEFKQLEGLTIPHKPQLLEDEVTKYLEQLRQDNARIIDAESAIKDDMVMMEISFAHGSDTYTKKGVIFAGDGMNNRSLEALVGCKTGDTIESKLKGKAIMLAVSDTKLPLEHEFEYDCQIMVNSITRRQIPELDDEFAKDMEFDSLTLMKEKISEDMRLKNEHININVDNYSIITKLFVDNNFDLPTKTIDYLAEQEAEKIDKPEYRKYYLYQYRIQIAQEMVSMYILNNLRKAMPIDISEEMMEEYIIHEAILEDISAEAYKEANKDELNRDSFKQAAQNYFILRGIAAKSEYIIAEEPAEEEISDAETVENTEE